MIKRDYVLYSEGFRDKRARARVCVRACRASRAGRERRGEQRRVGAFVPTEPLISQAN